jgi:glycosyltransferase involved in cell wall biosynthesis
MKKITVVVPCYNEQDSLQCFYDSVKVVLDKLSEKINYEILFVNDGSKDLTQEKITEIVHRDEKVSLLSLSRCFGKESAMLAGFEYATGDAIIVMDVDLQDPPELIPLMIKKWENGIPVVCTRRKDRNHEPLLKSMFSILFYKLFNKMTSLNIPQGVRDFRLMDRKVILSILSLKERLRFSKGLFEWIGYEKVYLEFENRERKNGKSSWSFWKLFFYGIEAIVSFTVTPIRVATILGLGISFLSFLFLAYVIMDKFFNGNPVSGYPSLISITLFIGGVQLISMGLIGEYLGRVFYEVKARPHYIVSEVIKNEHLN